MEHGLEMTSANPAAFAVPPRAIFAGDRLMQLEASLAYVGSQFVNEREFITSSRAVEKRDSLRGMHPDRMIEHRPNRSDARPSSNKQQMRLIDGCGKGKCADRSVDIQEGACGGPPQIFRSPLHRNQQFERARFGGTLR